MESSSRVRSMVTVMTSSLSVSGVPAAPRSLTSLRRSIEPAQGVGGPQARGAPAAKRPGQQAARQSEPYGEQYQLDAHWSREVHGHRLRGLTQSGLHAG